MSAELSDAEKVLIFSMGWSVEEYWNMRQQFERQYAAIVNNSLCRDEYDARTAALIRGYGGLFNDIPQLSHFRIRQVHDAPPQDLGGFAAS